MIGLKSKTEFKAGDPVIYRMTKHSQNPGRRAKSVAPSPNGDDYKYQVDKFWVVDRILDDGQLLLRTRRGKTRVMRPDDFNLRPPAWWEFLLYRSYFPTKSEASQEVKSS
ncbi:hypothetical protein SH668x_003610 [Planctomicrobium sp. SH668]|uniref:hypothetical protein n=1 Tax=Planctomicrobium sp. SH668 TaxID=3448126 RepID=UPI003F5C6D5B